MPATAIVRAASAAAAMLLALCGGAVWAVVALVVRDDAPWMSAVVALAVLYALATLELARAAARASAALGLYALGVVYAQYLHGASAIASQLGIGYLDALSEIGPEMAYALAAARGDVVDVAIIVIVGIALAIVAWRGG